MFRIILHAFVFVSIDLNVVVLLLVVVVVVGHMSMVNPHHPRRSTTAPPRLCAQHQQHRNPQVEPGAWSTGSVGRHCFDESMAITGT